MDNDEKKWGNALYGHQIINPKKIVTNSSDGFFIFIASTYYDEISEQLRGMGFVEGWSFYRDLRLYADIFEACYPNLADIISGPLERIDLTRLTKQIRKIIYNDQRTVL